MDHFETKRKLKKLTEGEKLTSPISRLKFFQRYGYEVGKNNNFCHKTTNKLQRKIDMK
jgi:hypothetical protein